jgi:hypothetical protein
MNILKPLLVVAALSSFFWGCSDSNSGGNTETENVLARIVYADNSPASGAEVSLMEQSPSVEDLENKSVQIIITQADDNGIVQIASDSLKAEIEYFLLARQKGESSKLDSLNGLELIEEQDTLTIVLKENIKLTIVYRREIPPGTLDRYVLAGTTDLIVGTFGDVKKYDSLPHGSHMLRRVGKDNMIIPIGIKSLEPNTENELWINFSPKDFIDICTKDMLNRGGSDVLIQPICEYYFQSYVGCADLAEKDKAYNRPCFIPTIAMVVDSMAMVDGANFNSSDTVQPLPPQ